MGMFVSGSTLTCHSVDGTHRVVMIPPPPQPHTHVPPRVAFLLIWWQNITLEQVEEGSGVKERMVAEGKTRQMMMVRGRENRTRGRNVEEKGVCWELWQGQGLWL